MNTNLNKPMTTQRAQERYRCECTEEDNCDCLLSATCSFLCPKCRGTIWLPSYTQNAGNPTHVDCPYCDREYITNPYPEIRYVKGRY